MRGRCLDLRRDCVPEPGEALQAAGPSSQSPLAPQSVRVWCVVRSHLEASRKILSTLTLGRAWGLVTPNLVVFSALIFCPSLPMRVSGMSGVAKLSRNARGPWPSRSPRPFATSPSRIRTASHLLDHPWCRARDWQAALPWLSYPGIAL